MKLAVCFHDSLNNSLSLTQPIDSVINNDKSENV